MLDVGDVLDPILAFLAAHRPFAEISRVAGVSKTWRTVSLKALKTAPQLILSPFAASVKDGDVRLALRRVASENLKVVDLSGCYQITADGMEDILQIMTSSGVGVKEVDLTACSDKAVLRAVATRAQAALGAPKARDLFAHLSSLGEEGERFAFSKLGSLLVHASPLLLFDTALYPGKSALFQAAAHGTGSDMAMLLSLSFGMKTYDPNKISPKGNSPLLLACKSGNFQAAEILVAAGADVSAVNEVSDLCMIRCLGLYVPVYYSFTCCVCVCVCVCVCTQVSWDVCDSSVSLSLSLSLCIYM
jgi:hypothetical protein